MEVLKVQSLTVRVVVEEEAMKASMICDYFELFQYWVFSVTDQQGNYKYMGVKNTFNGEGETPERV